MRHSNLLIVANSARMLAEKAKKAGYSCLVIDCFSDVDTNELALECVKVDSLALKWVKKAFFSVKKKYRITHVVYGSGLEHHLNTLEFLHQYLTVLGNPPNVFAWVQHKPSFFSTLSQLEIPYPETVFSPPLKNFSHWLIKPMRGEGGVGIKVYNGEQPEKGRSCYWQKHIAGIPMSVLFKADGENIKIYGFHKQWTIALTDNEFLFSGLVSQPDFNNAMQHQISCWLMQLANELSLTGFNSLDFIYTNEQCYVLELNARPSASMQLYNENVSSACFFDGDLPFVSPPLINYQASKIIFSEVECVIKQGIQWPEWAMDIPQPHSNINTGMPICSIIADGESERQVDELLLLRQRIILDKLVLE